MPPSLGFTPTATLLDWYQQLVGRDHSGAASRNGLFVSRLQECLAAQPLSAALTRHHHQPPCGVDVDCRNARDNDDDAPTASHVPAWPPVQSLNLANLGLGRIGIRPVIQCLAQDRHRWLELNLADNRLDNQSCQLLCDAWLDPPPVGTGRFGGLSSRPSEPTIALQRLVLDGNLMSGQGAAHLVGLIQRVPSLRVVSVKRCSLIPRAWCEAIEAALQQKSLGGLEEP